MSRRIAMSQNEEVAWDLLEKYEDPEHTWFRLQGKALLRLRHTSPGDWTQSGHINGRFNIDEDYEKYATGSDPTEQAYSIMVVAKADSATGNRFQFSPPKVYALLLKATETKLNSYCRIGLAQVPIRVFEDKANWGVQTLTLSR
jgi:hypothetical protein